VKEGEPWPMGSSVVALKERKGKGVSQEICLRNVAERKRGRTAVSMETDLVARFLKKGFVGGEGSGSAWC